MHCCQIRFQTFEELDIRVLMIYISLQIMCRSNLVKVFIDWLKVQSI